MNPGRTGRQAMLILINIVVALLISQACKNSVDPSPAAIRALQWSEDIDYFGQELAARQKDFAQLTSVGQFNKSLENLKSEISSLEDAEIFLKLLEMVSALRVAHINIYPSPFDRFHLLPIVIQVFEDGVYIIQTTDEVPHLLGQRIIAVNGYPIETIMDSLQKMISYENQYWMIKQFSLIFNNSEMLKYYGFADSHDVIEISTDGTGTFSLPIREIQLLERPTITWQHVLPSASFPAYMRNTDLNYWFSHFPSSKILYVKYNVCLEAEDESFASFTKNITSTISANSPEKNRH
jgi:hypothetical protein